MRCTPHHSPLTTTHSLLTTHSAMPTALTTRFAALPAPPPEAALQLTTGTMADYAALAGFHYRSHRPATATRVLVMTHHHATAADRYVGRPARRQVAAVLVESLPALGCRLRDLALGGRYAVGDRRQRARLLNAEVRCISRVVVHPQWRGTGLAVRLVRAALDTATTPVTEALAAMGHVHPFFERAGMTAYRRPAHARDARLADALATAGIDLPQLADADAVARRIADSPHRAWLEHELRRWLRGPDTDVREVLVRARQRLMGEPVYYVRGVGSRE